MDELIQALMPYLEEYGVYAAKEQLVITTERNKHFIFYYPTIPTEKVLLEQ